MKKRFFAVTIFAFLIMFAGTSIAADTIKIGVLFPLSGRAADLGITGREGTELAVKEINEKGGVLGKKLEIIVTDSKANTQESVTIARKYIQKDKVNFLFGVVSSAVSLAIAEVAKSEKIIFMNTIGSTDSLTKEKWNKYVFRSGICNSQEGNALAIHTAKKGYKKYYNIGPDYEYGRTLWEIFKKKTKELNPSAEFTGEQWPKLFIGDYTPYINAIIQAKPDAVFCSLWGGDLVAFIKQAKPFGVFEKIKWIIPTGGDVTTVQALGNEMPTGLYVDQRYYFHWPNTKRNKEFTDKYKKAYNKYPSAWALQSYDGIYFLVEAIKKAKSLDTEKVITALEGLTIESPRGKSSLRKEDHQLYCDYAVGVTKKDSKYPFLIVGDMEVIKAEKVIYSVNEWKKALGK